MSRTRLFLALLLALLLPATLPAKRAPRAPSFPTLTQPAPQTRTVYITRTGKKYHRAGCQYLARSSIAVDLRQAATYYTPCSRCW